MKPKTFRTRFFNTITYNPRWDTVTKTSDNKAALRNEINWYRSIPRELGRHHPRVIASSMGDTPFLTMEYVRQPLLGDLFVSSRCHAYDWPFILQSLLGLLREFSRHAAPGIDARSIYDMAVVKTARRTKQLLDGNQAVAGFYRRGFFVLNGKHAICPIRWFETNIATVAHLAAHPSLHMIHGDMHFSNMFYDDVSRALRLIDPRGSFGAYGIHGDPRYDLGKIRHSMSGYEHIVHQQFVVDSHPGRIDLDVHRTGLHESMVRLWDELTAAVNREVRLWEILSFLSLMSLHKDDARKQLAFYAVTASLVEDFMGG